MKVTVIFFFFAVELQKVRTTCIHSDFWARTGATCTFVRGKKYRKKIWNLHRDKAIIMSYF